MGSIDITGQHGAGPAPITIRQICAIDAVAARTSIIQASEHLATSQSTLSRYIAGAERALGQRLFQRGWTGMEPTSEGEVVIAHCRRMVSAINATQADLELRRPRVAELGHHLTWDMFKALDAVQATGSVSAAATYLQASQPYVSRLLSRMAAAIDRPLFQRTRNGMAATGDAVILSELHSKLLADILPLPEQIAALSSEVTGRVSVGLLPFSEQDTVVKAFGKLLYRHKHVRLRAVTGAYAALIEGLRRGELDFVVGALRQPPPYNDLEEVQLYDESFCVVVRADHPLATGRPILRDLVQENWIVAPHGTPTRQYFDNWLLSEGVTPPFQISEIVTFFLAEQMILHSNSVGLLTYSDRKGAELRSELKILPMRLPDSRRAIGLTFRKDHRLTIAQQAFVDIIGQEWNPIRVEDPG